MLKSILKLFFVKLNIYYNHKLFVFLYTKESYVELCYGIFHFYTKSKSLSKSNILFADQQMNNRFEIVSNDIILILNTKVKRRNENACIRLKIRVDEELRPNWPFVVSLSSFIL